MVHIQENLKYASTEYLHKYNFPIILRQFAQYFFCLCHRNVTVQHTVAMCIIMCIVNVIINIVLYKWNNLRILHISCLKLIFHQCINMLTVQFLSFYFHNQFHLFIIYAQVWFLIKIILSVEQKQMVVFYPKQQLCSVHYVK